MTNRRPRPGAITGAGAGVITGGVITTAGAGATTTAGAGGTRAGTDRITASMPPWATGRRTTSGRSTPTTTPPTRTRTTPRSTRILATDTISDGRLAPAQ